jgi:hypothetical protein
MQQWPRCLNLTISALLIFQLTGCGTLLYPERRGQTGGRLDTGIVILDAVGLLFFLIPGIIAFAVDFSNGTIYLPAKPVITGKADLREIKFDPKHTSVAQLEALIKEKTGYAVNLKKENVRISRLNSSHEMMERFAQLPTVKKDSQLAFNL